MLSTFPATTFSSDGLFPNLFQTYETGFTPWDTIEPAFLFPQEIDQEPVFSPKQYTTPSEPVLSNSGSGSDDSKPDSFHCSSGSDEPPDRNNNNYINSNCGSKRPRMTPNRDVDERKKRRMVSNRESARRSRMRKQQHLENLRNQVNRSKLGNRELMNRVRFMTHQVQLVQCDNERLRTDSAVLRQRLEDIRQILIARQLEQQFSYHSAWACNNMELQRPL